MKKGKSSSRQSKSKGKERAGKPKKEPIVEKVDLEKIERLHGTKVLVPLLSKREAHPVFIERVASGAREVILLLVIDTKAMAGQFGFATNEIAAGNHLMALMKEALGKKRKTCNDVIEWGDTASKIEHLAELYRVDRVFLVKQDNQYFQKLLEDMRENMKGIETEVVALPGE